MNDSPSPSKIQAEVARKNQQVRVLAKSVQLIWFFAGTIEALLVLGIVLKALSVNTVYAMVTEGIVRLLFILFKP